MAQGNGVGPSPCHELPNVPTDWWFTTRGYRIAKDISTKAIKSPLSDSLLFGNAIDGQTPEFKQAIFEGNSSLCRSLSIKNYFTPVLLLVLAFR